MKECFFIEGLNKIMIIYEIKVDELIEEVVFDIINFFKSFYVFFDCCLVVI